MKLSRKEILNEFVKLMLGALAMISALAWNDAFRNFFQQYPSLKTYGPWVYAIVVTLLVIILMATITYMHSKVK